MPRRAPFTEGRVQNYLGNAHIYMDHFSIIRFPYTLHLNRLHFVNMHKFQRIFLWSYKYLSTLFTIIKHVLYLNDVFFANTLGGVSEKYQVWGWGAKFVLLPTLLSSADREMGLAQRKVVPSTTTKSFLWTSFSRLCISVLSANNRHGKGRTSRRCHNESYIHVVTFLFVSFYIMSFMKDSYWKISIYDPFLSFFTI